MFKILCCALGFAYAGPRGLLIGLISGIVLDELFRVLSYKVCQKFRSVKQKRAFIKATFSMLGAFTKADGPVVPEEIKAIEYLMDNAFCLSSSEKKLAIKAFTKAKTRPKEFFKSAAKLRRMQSPAYLETHLDLLLLVAAADGELNSTENDMLYSACNIFEISPLILEAKRAVYTCRENKKNAALAHSYSVLNCNQAASDSEIKQNYRSLVKDYHPDTIAAKDLPDDFQQFANDKFRHIQSAYEAICSARGI